MSIAVSNLSFQEAILSSEWWLRIYIYVYIYTCIYKYIHTYINTHHTHTHTSNLFRSQVASTGWAWLDVLRALCATKGLLQRRKRANHAHFSPRSCVTVPKDRPVPSLSAANAFSQNLLASFHAIHRVPLTNIPRSIPRILCYRFVYRTSGCFWPRIRLERVLHRTWCRRRKRKPSLAFPLTRDRFLQPLSREPTSFQGQRKRRVTFTDELRTRVVQVCEDWEVPFVRIVFFHWSQLTKTVHRDTRNSIARLISTQFPSTLATVPQI